MSAPNPLLQRLLDEKSSQMKGGIYHKTQVALTYNSNHIEGSKLTEEQTRYIFETSAIGVTDQAVSVDDVMETVNHFRCIDDVLETVYEPITERYIKKLHASLKNNTKQSRLDWFAVGDYKKLPNEVGNMATIEPEQVHVEMNKLIREYNRLIDQTLTCVSLDDILDFHVRFESIHPFQDGNGRVGRLLMFKECLRNSIVPFIITDDMKMFYYRGLKEWKDEPGYLRDTCLAAQDQYKKYLDYFRIPYV